MIKYIYSFIISILIFGLFCSFFQSMGSKEDAFTVSLNLQADVDDTFQVFYSKSGSFNADDSQKIEVVGGEKFQKISFNIPLDYPNLRIDLGNESSQKKVRIKEIVLDSPSSKRKVFSGVDLINLVDPNEYISNIEIDDGISVVYTKAINNRYDPYFSNINMSNVLGIEQGDVDLFFTCQVDKQDIIQVFFGNNSDKFNEKNSSKTNLTGSSNFQTHTVKIPANYQFIRLDLGNNPLQEKITFKEIGFSTKNNRKVYNGEQINTLFSTNQFVQDKTLSDNLVTFSTKMINNQFDPYINPINVKDFFNLSPIQNTTLWDKYKIPLICLSILPVLIFLFLVYKKKINIPSNTHFLFNLLFLSLLVLPFIQQNTSFVNLDSVKIIEKREKVSKPKFETLKTFPRLFESYYDDNFGFRDLLINTGKYLKYSVFKVSTNHNKVLVGKENWLFYNDESMQDFYTNRNLYTLSELKKICEKWSQQKESLEKKGIKYYKTFYPNKHTIYGEMMSNRMTKSIKDTITKTDQLLQHLTKCSPSLNVIDSREELIASKNISPLYKKYDSHWNAYGAYIAYKKVFSEIAKDYPRLNPINEKKFNISSVDFNDRPDLVNLAGLQWNNFSEERPIFKLKNAKRSKYKKLPTGGFPKTTIIHENPNVNNDLVALVFRDSYTAALEEFYSLHFRKIYYIWTPYQQSMVDKIKPNIVIDGHVERNLELQ